MHRRFRHSTKQKPGIRLRTVLYAGTLCVGLVFGFALFVVQLFKDETGMAASNPMVISGFVVTQDTTPVFRGTSSQIMLRINVQTKGVNHKLALNAIELSARGTSKEAYDLIENARVWTTGNDPNFSTSKQLGTTLHAVPMGNFHVSTGYMLQDGNNYFWFTYDISPKSNNGKFILDAECIALKIGTLEYDPPVAAPPGARILLNNIPYFSTGNTDVSSLKSWNSLRDGSGKAPVNFNDMTATFHIQAGHLMENKLSACIPILLVEKNGFLKSSSDIRTNLLEIETGGTYIQNKTLKSPQSVKVLKIKNNGNFVHANTGRLPGMRKMIESSGNVILTSYSEVTFSDNISWGNLIVDAPDINSTDFGNSLKIINGDLELRSTGKNAELFTSTLDTLLIHGNLIINGGNLVLGNNKTVNLAVAKGIIVKKGSLKDNYPLKTNKGSVIINAGNQLAFTGGEFALKSKSSIIQITKPVDWIQLKNATVELPDVIVSQGGKINVTSELIGEVNGENKLIIQKSGSLNIGTAVLKGTGIFVMEEGSTISTAHPEGINSSGFSGSIQTNKRYFHSGANYYFTGNFTPQKTGVFETDPSAGTVHNLGISKGAVTDILVLDQSFKVTGDLVRLKGNINKNSHNLIYRNAGDEVSVTNVQRQDSSF